jgi:hypothetical protein
MADVAATGAFGSKILLFHERPTVGDLDPVGRHIQPALLIGILSGGLILGVGLLFLGF